MFNLDPAKLLIIAVVAVILLGPDKLPQVARQAGAAWRTFNDFRHRMENEVRSSIPDLPSSTDIARLARSPSALLNHLSNLSPEADDAGEASLNGNGNGTAANGTAAVHVDGETSAYQPGTESLLDGHEGNAASQPPPTSVPPTSAIPNSDPHPGQGIGSAPVLPADPSLN